MTHNKCKLLLLLNEKRNHHHQFANAKLLAYGCWNSCSFESRKFITNRKTNFKIIRCLILATCTSQTQTE